MKIKLLFNILILPSIALKRRNFPDNLNFKGKTVTKFVIRSHFPLIYNSMTITMGPFKNYVTCIIAFFIPFTCITLCQFYSFMSSLFFTENKELWNERKEDFLYIWLLQRIMAASAFYIYGCFSVLHYFKGGRLHL